MVRACIEAAYAEEPAAKEATAGAFATACDGQENIIDPATIAR